MTLLQNKHNIQLNSKTFNLLMAPSVAPLKSCPQLESRGDKPLKFTFENQFKALIYYHLEAHNSGRHLLSALKNDEFAASEIAPAGGVSKSTFFEAINSRGLEQLINIFTRLQKKASSILPGSKAYKDLGELVAIDGSLIDACLSMTWADYSSDYQKAKVHIGFDVSKGIPTKIYLSDGKGNERAYANKIIQPGQTGIYDRGYQCYINFDEWQKDSKHFIARIRNNSNKTVIKENPLNSHSHIFYDAIVLLGIKGINQTQKEVRVIGYKIDGKKYWIATDRFDLSAEDIALIYKLRWTVETFFGWWKRHLKVYHLIARSYHGLLVQVIAGLITYLLLAIYCKEKYGEKPSIDRVRQLLFDIRRDVIFSARQHWEALLYTISRTMWVPPLQ